MICLRCSKEFDDSFTFCPYCGKRSVAGTAPVQRRKRRRPKGTGSVYQQKDVKRVSAWRAVDGAGHTVGYYPSSAEAVIALDRWNADHKPKEYVHLSFSEVYDLWSAAHYKEIGKTAVSALKSAYQKSASLHDRKMAELKTQDYQDVIDTLEQDGASLSLCQKQKQLYSMMCAYAMQQDIIDRNYATYLKIHAKEKDSAKNDRVFTAEEIKRVEECAATDATARLVMILLYSGMRVGELLGMLKKDVDLTARVMVGGEKTEAGRNRTIPIHPKIHAYVSELMQTPGPYLVSTAKSTQMDVRNFRRSFTALMKKLDINGVKIHSTRHTTSTLLLRSGVRPDVIKSILGHAKISTTVDIYDHPDNEDLLKGIEAI